MDKCKEKYCHWYSPNDKDNCSYYTSISECDGKPAETEVTKQLRAELKIAKRVALLMAEKLEHNKLNEISSCHDYDCIKDKYNSSENSGPCIKCMIDYYKLEAKEE